MSFKIAAIIALAGLAASNPIAAPQLLDLKFIAAQGPAPVPHIAVGVLSQVISFNPTAAASAAAAAATAVAKASGSATALDKRAACAPQPTGAGPVAVPDTVSAWQSMAAMSSAAANAATPSGYVKMFSNIGAANSANGYLGYYTMDTYDTQKCSALCDAANGCAAFNIYMERDPIVDPGTSCSNPNSTTTIKCTLWGGPVTLDNANNNGQWRNDFQVVIGGSNGYVNQTIDSVPGYTTANYIGNAAINAPGNANSYMGLVLFNDGKPFDSGRCAAACSAQSNYARANPPADGSAPQLCKFFNTYILNNNTVPIGQTCTMYSKTWDNSYATNDGQWDSYGNHVSITYSYSFSNTTAN